MFAPVSCLTRPRTVRHCKSRLSARCAHLPHQKSKTKSQPERHLGGEYEERFLLLLLVATRGIGAKAQVRRLLEEHAPHILRLLIQKATSQDTNEKQAGSQQGCTVALRGCRREVAGASSSKGTPSTSESTLQTNVSRTKRRLVVIMAAMATSSCSSSFRFFSSSMGISSSFRFARGARNCSAKESGLCAGSARHLSSSFMNVKPPRPIPSRASVASPGAAAARSSALSSGQYKTAEA